jgi:glutamate formiminotransferase
VDVVPIVPLVPQHMDQAKEVALDVAQRVGGELDVPVFLYGLVGADRRPAYFRRGGLTELQRRVEAGELRPDAGPAAVEPRSGAMLVGARPALVAYNVDLRTTDVEVARAIASTIRESGGGMPGVQAIGLALPRSARVQVSMNVLDLVRSPLHEVVGRVEREAAARGVAVVDGELVGLVPETVFSDAKAAGVDIRGIDESRVLERALGAAGST